jgi:hypothetical protein
LWRERYGGFKNWVDPMVLDSDATYQRLGLNFQEMHFEVLDERDETRICMVLKVPPIIIGTTAGLRRSTYANYGEARKSFWEDGLIPQFKRIRDRAQGDLAAEFGADVDLQWDYSDVPALQEDRKARWDMAKQALAAGGITRNEYRLKLDYPEDPIRGDVYLVPTTVTEVPVGQPIDVTGAADAAGQAETSTSAQDDTTGDGLSNGDTGGAATAATDTAAEPGGKSAKSRAADERQRRKREKELQAAMESYFAGQVKRIKQDVTNA